MKNILSVDERPVEVVERAMLDHRRIRRFRTRFARDLIISKYARTSTTVTLVERTTR